MREAARARDGDRAAAEQLYQKLGQPPGPWLRAWVGGLSRVVKVSAMILGGVALIWAVLLKLLGSLDTSSDKDNDMGGVLLALVIGIPVAIFFGTAFILAKIVRVVAPVLGVDLIDVWSFSGGFALIGVILFILSIVPYALHQYIDAFAGIRRKIQASLAAQPPSHAGGAACCRNCGAALTVPGEALGVRCDYCQTDNLVSLPADWIAAVKNEERMLKLDIDEAELKEMTTRQNAAVTAWKIGALGFLIIPALGLFGLAAEHTHWLDGRSGWRAAVAQAHRDTLPHDDNPESRIGYDVALRSGETLTLLATTDPSPFHYVIGRMGMDSVQPLAFQHDPQQQHYAASFRAPYSGWFVVQLDASGAKSSGDHLQLQVAARRRR